MKMDGDIRVKTEAKYRKIYNGLKNFAFGDMHELFFLCVSLAYKNNKRKSLGKYGDDRFWSRTITPDEWACYYAIIIEVSKMDFKSILDDRNVLAVMEEYANAGIEILIDEILSMYIVNKNGEPEIDPGNSRELPKILMSYIYDQLPELSS